MDMCSLTLFALAFGGLPSPLAAQDSPTLLVDLNTDPFDGSLGDDGQVEVRGAALGRLWLNGKTFDNAGPVFTLSLIHI